MAGYFTPAEIFDNFFGKSHALFLNDKGSYLFSIFLRGDGGNLYVVQMQA